MLSGRFVFCGESRRKTSKNDDRGDWTGRDLTAKILVAPDRPLSPCFPSQQ